MVELKPLIYSMATGACVDKLLSIPTGNNQTTGVNASHQELQLARFARQDDSGSNVIGD